MFLKRLERRKNGKKHTYWALVESIKVPIGIGAKCDVSMRPSPS